MGGGNDGAGTGPCATSACPPTRHTPIPTHASARPRRICRFTDTISLKEWRSFAVARRVGARGPAGYLLKSTFGSCLASGGTSQYGCSLNPNTFAVTLEGNL